MADNIKIKIDIALDPGGVGKGAAETQARLDKLADAMTAAFTKSADAERKVTDESKKLDEQQKKLGETLGGMANKIGAYNLAWQQGYNALVAAVGAVKDYIKESALLNARYETMGVVLEVVGRNAGYSRTEMEMYTAAVAKSGITMIASREAVVKMVQANMDLDNATKLARVAQDAAVIGNINSSQAFERLIYAIQSGQPEMLRTLGINVQFEGAYKTLAKQLKVNVDQLTEQEKVQARANVVMESSTRIAGTYEAAMDTAGKKLNSTARYVENLKVRLGETFNEALVLAVDNYTDALKGANEEARLLANDKALQEMGENITTTFAWTGDIVVGAWDAIATAVEQTVSLSLKGMNALRHGLISAFPGGAVVAKLLGDLSGHDLDLAISSFTGIADANLKNRIARPQLRDKLAEFRETRDQERADRGMEGDWEGSGGTDVGGRPAGKREISAAEKRALEKARREEQRQADWVAARQLEGEQRFAQDVTGAWKAYEEAVKKGMDTTTHFVELAEDGSVRVTKSIGQVFNDPDKKKMMTQWFKDIDDEQQRAIDEGADYLATLEKKGDSTFESLKQSVEGWGRDFSETMGEAVVTFDFSMDKMGGAVKSLLSDIAAQLIQKQFTDPFIKFATAGIGKLFGPGGAMAGFEGHTGAVAGIEGTPRMIPAAVMAGARRMHKGGLAANEVPMILERGEEVLTRRDPRHRYNMGAGAMTFAPVMMINVENKTSQPVQVKQNGPAMMSSGQLVVNLLLEELGNSPAARNALSGALS